MHKTLNLLFILVLQSCYVFAQNIYYVRTDGSDANSGKSNTAAEAKATLSSAVSAASSGDVIQIAAGNYSGSGFQNISLGTKYLKIIGAGNGTNPATSTIITGPGSGKFLTMAKGGSSTNRMEVWNMNLSGYAYYFFDTDDDTYLYKISITGATSYQQMALTFVDDANGIDVEGCSFTGLWAYTTQYDVGSESGTVFYVDDNIDIYNLNVRQCLFDQNYIVMYISQSGAGSSKIDADNITFTNCVFSDNSYKGIYAERLDDFTIDNCSFVNTGKSITAHPAAIDINLKWETFSGIITIKNSNFTGCAIPNSGTNVNGAAVMFKSRDFGGYAGDPAAFTGDFSIQNCIFKNNNAGIRFGESNNGSGTSSGNNASYGSGVMEVKNCIIQTNTGGSYQTYNHFGIRNVTTRNVNVTNCYFGGSAASTNTAFTASGGIDVSNTNGGNGGACTVSGTLTTGDVIRLNSSNTYQANYASLSSAISAASDGDKIIFPPTSVTGTTTVSNNLTFITPGSGRLYASHQSSFQNLTVSGNKTLTLESDYKVSSALSVTSGNGLSLGKYFTLELAGTLTTGGTFTGGVTSAVPNSELLVSGSGNITLPAFTNGLAVLTITRGASDVISLGANLSLTNVYFSGASIDLNGFKLTISGASLLNSSTISGATTGSELEITGSNRTFQLNGGTHANLTVNRVQGLQLNADLTITNVLTLTNGCLFLGSFNCTIASGASINGTPSASKMIVATGTGQLRKMYTTTGSFTFPVGDDAGTFEYSPVVLNFTSGTFGSGAYAAVNLSDIKHTSNGSTTDFLSRFWTVTQNNISSFSCATSFTYLDADINGTESNLKGGKFTSGTWLDIGSVTAATNLVTGTVSSFSDFTAGEAAMVPVTWLGVQAEVAGTADAIIRWSTASELNNDYFEIEYSVDGISFEPAGKVKGRGTVPTVSEYAFVHTGAFEQHSMVYYRIRQVDFNGDWSYSSVVVAGYERRQQLVPYPNPFTHEVTIRMPDNSFVSEIILLDLAGNQFPVTGFKQTDATIVLEGLETLAAGVYLAKITSAQGVQFCKLIK